MEIRALRGATTVAHNDAEAILTATAALLSALARENGLSARDLVCLFFTVTPDLDAAFAAQAAERVGWGDVPRLGAVEQKVPGAPERCVRVMAIARGNGPRVPVYLGEASRLLGKAEPN